MHLLTVPVIPAAAAVTHCLDECYRPDHRGQLRPVRERRERGSGESNGQSQASPGNHSNGVCRAPLHSSNSRVIFFCPSVGTHGHRGIHMVHIWMDGQMTQQHADRKHQWRSFPPALGTLVLELTFSFGVRAGIMRPVFSGGRTGAGAGHNSTGGFEGIDTKQTR